MLAPLSWLKEFVDIKADPKTLGEKLTEVGLGREDTKKSDDGDIIFEFEVTPNRPDLLSIIGVAREVAAVERSKIKNQIAKTQIKDQKSKDTAFLPINIVNDLNLCPRYTGIVIKDVKVRESPDLIKERLTKIGLRPINNLVDITNYAMFELGNPLHVFDYEKIKGSYMKIVQASGGEEFVSLDEKKYILTRGAIIIKDGEGRVIDLCGIKGGLNAAVDENTSNIFIHVPIYTPNLIRRASQTLNLSSDASKIYERGASAGGTVETLTRAVELVLKHAGGEIAGELIDLKKENLPAGEAGFEPWKLRLSHNNLTKILGVNLDPKVVKSLLERLGLQTEVNRKQRTVNYTVTIPTYRGDLKIEEDLTEEVARLYGYNNFPKTILIGTDFQTKTIPYVKDYSLEQKIKNILKACGFSEVYTYSLISESDLSKLLLKESGVLRVDNPVSREYEYLRPTLFVGLLNAIAQNRKQKKEIKLNLFELGKVYLGKTIDKAKEGNSLTLVSSTLDFAGIKGGVEEIFFELNIGNGIKYAKGDEKKGVFEKNQSTKILYNGRWIGKLGVLSGDILQNFGIQESISAVEIDYSLIESLPKEEKVFIALPKFPPIIEDISVIANPKIIYDEITKLIKKQSNLIAKIELIDTYHDKKTLRIIYQHKDRNLTSEEVSKIRERIYKAVEKELRAKIV